MSRWASNCRCTSSASPITAPSTSSGALGSRTRQTRRTEGLSHVGSCCCRSCCCSAGREGGWVAHEDSRRLGGVASTAHCRDFGGLVVERVEVLLEHGGAHVALAEVCKPNVERVRGQQQLAGGRPRRFQRAGPGAPQHRAHARQRGQRHIAATLRGSPCSVPRSKRSERPAGVHTIDAPCMGPRRSRRLAWNKALHFLVNAVMLQMTGTHWRSPRPPPPGPHAGVRRSPYSRNTRRAWARRAAHGPVSAEGSTCQKCASRARRRVAAGGRATPSWR